MMQVLDKPVVTTPQGRRVDRMSYEASALGAMRGKPGVVQFYGSCLSPPGANPQRGYIITE